MWEFLADAVVFVHFLWILFLVLGAFLGVRYRAVKLLHIGGIIFALVMQVRGWYCPLTYLENWLRSLHDPSSAYEGSFIVQYLEEIVYMDISPQLIFSLTLVVSAVNTWIYSRKTLKR